MSRRRATAPHAIGGPHRSARRSLVLTAACACVLTLALGARAAGAGFVAFESGPVRPLASSPDGGRLFAANTPDNALEIFAVESAGLRHLASVPVGLEPVAVAARTDDEVWVVNHLSDSISIVDVAAAPPRVVRTLLVGDEPRDLVFAGAGGRRAFVTTAHRGQHRPGDPELTTAGVGRADVWVFDAALPGAALGGTPLAILTLFADTPRALAASPDGSRVFAAGFHSGNRTTALHEGLVCDGGAMAPPCNVSGHPMPGGLPAPNTNVDLVPQPEVGLIVRFDGHDWRDGLGRAWNAAVRFALPDEDVFTIDALADPPVAIAAASGVGTILFGMVVHPRTGAVYVTNTEARNEVRFEGPGALGSSSVRGHLHEARVSIVHPDGTVTARRLNPHIDYDVVPSPPGVKERSLATPTAMAITADGSRLYVAGFGSSAVVVLDTAALEHGPVDPDAAHRIAVSGGGPAGLVLDEARERLYVATRFDDGIAVVDTATRREIAHVVLHNPEPPSLVAGRRFLYDAEHTSSNGQASCAACHVFGDLDSLGWDLGDPSGRVLTNANPRLPGVDRSPDFHPMKGPMTTQSLRGLAHAGPMHWRGDRTGGLDAPSVVPDAGAFDEVAAFTQFNGAFVGLLGRSAPLAPAEMEAFTAFALQITYPPNPVRALDGGLTPDQAAGRAFFFESHPSDVTGTCDVCHQVDAAAGSFGTNGLSVVEPQAFKIPHLRNAYQKVGMFGMPHVPNVLPGFGFNATEHVFRGDQIRGFGFTHDGSVDTVFRFLTREGFNRGPGNAGGFTVDAAGDARRRQVEQFVLAFDSDLAPIVGQQVSATATTFEASEVTARIALLVARDVAGDCELVVKGVLDGEARGWLWDDAIAAFRSDREADPPMSEDALRRQAGLGGQARTYTCVPPGTGMRIGLDRDDDRARDGDERDAGSDPADPASVPSTDAPTVLVRGATLELRDDQTAPIDRRRRRLRWRTAVGARASWTAIPAWDALGDPTRAGRAGGALLTISNADGSGERVTIGLPAEHWRRRGSAAHPRGYRYDDPARLAGPITHVAIDRRGAVDLRGGGPWFGYTLDEPAQGKIAVRLQLGRGDVWCTTFTAKPGRDARNDRPGRFVGSRQRAVPTDCPP